MSVYALKPQEVEAYYHDKHTDVILRKNIRQVQYTLDNHAEVTGIPQTSWECEEKQFRYPGKLSVAEIQADPDKWWNYTPAAPKPPRDLETRVTDLEEAVDMIVNEVVV